MIKHYESILVSRSALVVNVSEIASLQTACIVQDDGLCRVDLIIQGVEVIYHLFVDELEGLIEDMKAEDNPKYEITNMDDFVNGSPAIIRPVP